MPRTAEALDAILRSVLEQGRPAQDGPRDGELPPPVPLPTLPASAVNTVHRVKVSLAGARPPVWRRLEVPSDLPLSVLHEVLQTAFGWFDCHPHQFETRCGEFAIRPEVIEADDHFCADHLVLSTIYAPHQFIVRSLRPSIGLDADRLDAYVGGYRFENGPPIEIRRSGDHLTAQVEGLPEYELVPESETRFFYRVLGQRTLTFERDDAGRFDSLWLEGNGSGARAHRVR